MSTLAQVIERCGVDVLEHLDREALVPILGGLQAQGDVIVIPWAVIAGGGRPVLTPQTSVLTGGIAVVRGENGGNTHLLLAQGDVRWGLMEAGVGLGLGVLLVAPGATAYLAHPEHGYIGIAPGMYEIRRQREQADQIRLMRD